MIESRNDTRLSQVGVVGGGIRMNCSVRSSGNVSVKWMLPDGSKLEAPYRSSDNRITASPNGLTNLSKMQVASNGTLIIYHSQLSDNGYYKCVAGNQHGADSLATKVTLTRPSVVHADAPTPGRRFLILANGTLRITSATYTDRGVYKCISSNAAGADAASVHLMVAALPPVIQQLRRENITLSEGSIAYLNCSATGAPPPTISWTTPYGTQLWPSQFVSGTNTFVFPNGTLYIRHLGQVDAGKYECTATNTVGISLRALSLTVIQSVASARARITSSSAQKTEVIYGGRLQLDCVASGDPEPRVIWRTPSKKLVDAHYSSRSRRYVVFDNGTLFLNEVGMREQGNYTCYAENQIGKDEMKVHVKVVSDVPVIRNKTYEVVRVMYGESASLKCSVKGEVNPHILWISPTNRAITSASDKYLIHNDGTLFIHNVQRFDGGNYTCLARNSAGQDKKVYRLEILVSPPAINGLRGSTNSLKVSAMRDQRKLIHCEATGTPVPRVIWVLPENVVLPAPYYGAGMTVHRNGTLDIQSLKVTDAAFLTCIAQNEGGEAKLIIQLDVLDTIEKPRLRSPKMESLSLTVGRTLTLNCSVEGSPAPQVTWVLPGGTALMSGSRFTKFFHKTDGTLVISNPALSEAGNYRCLGRNAGGQVERTVVLSPGRKPEINNRYNSPVSIISGESLQLHCLSASDPVHLTWTLPSGVVLNRPQRAGRYTVLQNGTLSIQQASVYDRGSYTCRTANEYGSSLLTISVIIIAYPPRITSSPAATTYARRGVAVQLNCVVVGIPKAEVAWETPDRTRLIVSPQPRLFGNKYLHPQGSLIIQNPMPKDTGFYRCTARNVLGVDSRGAYLHVY
uniref:Ig-like domain-containing protein n=1 Tax=Electrophorus electricus TaxID=8005 RepID=A0A4W4FSF9_ELEEL